MAKLGIITGTTPNDGLGDNLLAGAVKINSNFSEIYNRFGDGTNLTAIGGTWTSTSAGIHTLKNVGIGTTNPRFKLEVGAVGASGTTLFVNGDARVTGIVTIGPASITLNGISNIINVGSGVTINGSTGTINATSINLGGTTLTGSAVTSITAGSGISVDQSTGNVTISATGGGGGESYWAETGVGIHTLSNVGIGTTNPTEKLTVSGNAVITGITTHLDKISFRTSLISSEVASLNNSGKLVLGDGTSTVAGIDIVNNTTSASAEIFTISTPSVNLYGKKIVVDYGGRLLLGGNLTGSINNALTIIDNSGNISLSGYVSVGGTIGASTIFANQLSVSGVSTFGGTINANNVGAGISVKLSNSVPTYLEMLGVGNYNATIKNIYDSNSSILVHSGAVELRSGGTSNYTVFNGAINGVASLYYQSSAVLSTQSDGVNVAGTTFTNQLSVSGISTLSTVQISSGIVTATSGIVTYFGDTSNTTDGRWTLGASGINDYTFTGIGFTQTTNDPVLYLARGRVYEFVNNSGGSHPFEIRVSNGGAAYSDGVTNNAAATGVIRFEIPFNAPNTLYYQCTVHSGMGNTISVYPSTI